MKKIDLFSKGKLGFVRGKAPNVQRLEIIERLLFVKKKENNKKPK